MKQSIVECVQGDITHETVDAIVNAANQHLAGGGGVDGAIHRAGGPTIMAELKKRYQGCPTGSAVITGGGRLKARYVIHAVGPRWRGGNHNEKGLLASAYRSSLELAHQHDCHIVAFPSISTGIYGYPVDEAALTALETIHYYVKKFPSFRTIRFVLFDLHTLDSYQKAHQKIVNTPLQTTVKHCPSCGAEFFCRPGDCWCEAVSLTETERKKIISQFNDCLCKKCLETRAKN